MNWGYRIVLTFVLFIALIATLVVISMRQDVNLVAEDYYKQEIEYQDQIDRLQRTSELSQQPEITLNRQRESLLVALNQEDIDEGEIVFFRPSDSSKDRVVAISSVDHEISTGGWDRGLWTVKLHWVSNGKEYYTEQTITL